jgi:peptidoglycan-N-acetylglucosamine deacetylase
VGDHTWDHLNIGDSSDTVNPFDTIPCTGETATTTPVFGTFKSGLTTITGLCPQYEIEDTALVIHEWTGVWPQWFRPPYGDYGPATGPSSNGQTNTQNTATLLSQVTTDLAKVAPGANSPATMSVTAWSTDSLDWCIANDTSTCLPRKWGTAAAVAANAEAVPSGGIILMHDAQQTTVDAIPLIVNAEAAKGLLPGKLATTTIAQAGPWVPLPPYYVAATAP